ncbi:indolepyruvate ferredoxin oxidoreductase family protein, partial [Pseudomonas sp. MWU13-2860]
VHPRSSALTAYQNAALAERCKALVARVRQAEEALNPASNALTLAVAKNYFHVLAYKDEYEVARLYTDGQFQRELAQQFDGDFQLRFHIGASWITGGQPRKVAFGPWLLTGMKWLAKLRFLRGGMLDPFSWQSDRKLERRLIGEFEQQVEALLGGLTLDAL